MAKNLSQAEFLGDGEFKIMSAEDFVGDGEFSVVGGSETSSLSLRPEVETYGAILPYEQGDNPLEAGLKATVNLPSSAYNFGKGIVKAVANPIDTLKAVGSTALGAAQKLTPGIQAQEENFDQFAAFLKERYGSLDNLQRTATNDPFGLGTDIVGLLTGGLGLAGKGATASSAISKTAGVVTKPATKAAVKSADLAAKTTKYGIGQATGLNPETITELVKNPQAFKNVPPEIRTQTAEAVKSALDSRLDELSDLGSGYQILRDTPGTVVIPEGTIEKVLGKYGVKLDDARRIVTDKESRPLSPGDRAALQDFIDNYGNTSVHSPNSFLNTREALSNLAKYDSSKTNISNAISRELRAEYDKVGKAQIRGLKELDTEYAPERELLGTLKKDIFDAKGELKDAAISRLANITGKGKEKLLVRVKEIVPDIEQRVRVIKAVEDIERTQGIKVGTYVRSGIAGGAALTGNIPALVAAILSQPDIAVPLLKGAGYVGQKAAPILETVKRIASDVNNFRIPEPILNPTNQRKLDLSDAATAGTPGEYLYHGTSDGALDNIAQEGLKPMRRGLLSLSKDEAYSRSYAESSRFPRKEGQGIMLRVKNDILKGKTVSSDKPRPASDDLYEVLTKATIPPEALEIYKNGKWQPLVKKSSKLKSPLPSDNSIE
jgi:hypothetical protein